MNNGDISWSNMNMNCGYNEPYREFNIPKTLKNQTGNEEGSK